MELPFLTPEKNIVFMVIIMLLHTPNSQMAANLGRGRIKHSLFVRREGEKEQSTCGKLEGHQY